jgi:hypothetical protein
MGSAVHALAHPDRPAPPPTALRKIAVDPRPRAARGPLSRSSPAPRVAFLALVAGVPL